MKKKNTMTGTEEDVLAGEREALSLFLDSVANEFNAEFSMFFMVVDGSARVVQLHIRENGKI